MWNGNTWGELDEDCIDENLALTGTVEAPRGAKRQRRPSVRLEELGYQPAAHSADKRKKKLGICALPHTRESPADSEDNLPLSSFAPNSFKTVKALNISRHGVQANNGGLYRHSDFDDGDGAQKADLSLSCCMDGSAKPHPTFEKASNVNKLQRLLNITSKKVRNGSRKPGVPKGTASVNKLTSMPRSGTSTRARCKGKVSGRQAVKDIHLDKENNAHTPAGFEASAYHKVLNTLEGGCHSDQGEMALLHSHQKLQSADYLPARAQVRGVRRYEWTQTSSRRQALKLTDDSDGKLLEQPNKSVHVPKGKLVIRENGSWHGTRNALVVEANGSSREPGKSSVEQHLLRQCSLPWFGIREWLQDLGLGKYARLFEAHEVEPEVLPLLTLDDLREMGVAAVGSRRKMFYAIQQFKMALLAEAN